jgi:cytochrome c-type biogenesis protein CcmH/NrfF
MNQYSQLQLAEAANAHLLASSLACLACSGNPIVNHDAQIQASCTPPQEALDSLHIRQVLER